MMGCGIYGIMNTKNNKVYIGKSTNTVERFIRHRSLLKNKKHYNQHLQHSYDFHGIETFEFKILEECSQKDLTIKEQQWVDKYGKDKLYNHVLDVVKLAGPSNPFYGRKHTEETKRKLSVQRIGTMLGKDNPNYGNKQPLIVRLKMTQNNAHTKLKEEQVKEIVQRLRNGEKHKDIANLFSINRTVVTRIANGTRWTNITGGSVLPVVYKDGVRWFSERHRSLIEQSRKGKKHTEETKRKISESRIKLFEQRRKLCLAAE